VRDLVEEVIREHFPTGGHLNQWSYGGPYAVGGLSQKVQKLATQRGLISDPRFWPTVIEHVWTLARVGAIALMPLEPTVVGTIEQDEIRIPTFVVTEYGRRLLSEPNFSPQDWEKYKAAALLEVRSTPDDVVVTYLAEAVGAWRSMQYRASVVMLGVACERLILMLAQSVVDASLATHSAKVKSALESPTPTPISRVYEDTRKPLVDPANPARLTPKLRGTIDRHLSAIFDHARTLRNAHGHPTGDDVSRNEAEIALRIFPGFYALVDELIGHLRSLVATASGGS
jgi:hypothetical protein